MQVGAETIDPNMEIEPSCETSLKTESSERSGNQENAYMWRLTWKPPLLTIFREYKEFFLIRTHVYRGRVFF